MHHAHLNFEQDWGSLIRVSVVQRHFALLGRGRERKLRASQPNQCVCVHGRTTVGANLAAPRRLPARYACPSRRTPQAAPSSTIRERPAQSHDGYITALLRAWRHIVAHLANFSKMAQLNNGRIDRMKRRRILSRDNAVKSRRGTATLVPCFTPCCLSTI